MSMNVRLYPCINRSLKGDYYSDICFELSSWVNVLKDIVDNSKPITLPVHIQWVNDMELRTPEEIDHECTFLTTAGVIKLLNLTCSHWTEDLDVRIRHRAIEKYFAELPDDWPVIVYYV